MFSMWCLAMVLATATINAAVQCQFWKRDLLLEEHQPDGILLFSREIETFVYCSLQCLLNEECRLFSYDDAKRSCFGFQKMIAKNWNSGDSRPIPKPIFHAGLDTIYVQYGAVTLLVRHQFASFYDSKTICSQTGDRLLILESMEKANDTLNFFAGQSITFWVGLTDIESEGRWLWENGDPFGEYDDFSTQFNDYDGGASSYGARTNADCAVFSPENKYIGDNNCFRDFQVVCEKIT